MEEIAFLGGEPFLQPQLYSVLNYLIQKGITDVRIKLTSNTTLYNEKILALKKFREVLYTLSIEAVGPLYSYIRGGEFSHAAVETNFRRMRSLGIFKFRSNSALSAYCAFGLADLYLWQKEHLPELPEHYEHSNWAPIYWPKYLGPYVLPHRVREQAFEYNVRKLKEFGVYTNIVGRGLERALTMHVPEDPLLTDQFIKFTRRLDQIRGESISAVVPEFRELFEARP